MEKYATEGMSERMGVSIYSRSQAVGAETLEQHDGVFASNAPHVGIKIMEQGLCLAVPYPPEVAGQGFQGLKSFRKMSVDGNVAPGGDIGVAYLQFHKM